jgi:hypothetical protein
MLAFFTPSPTVYGFGDASIGITAGRGIDGAGDTERRIDIAGDAPPKEDLLLWLMVLGGFIGSAREVGVPGHEGTGEPIALDDASMGIWGIWERKPISGGAGLLEEIRRPGKSIFMFIPILFGSSSRPSNVYVPSFVFRV